ncbi:MAG: protein rep [Candidatus Solibacter sp.]
MLTTTSDTRSVPDPAIDGKSEYGFPRATVVPAVDPASAELEYLSECSPKDRPWDQHRGQADDVAAIFAGAGGVWFSRLGQRVALCSLVLGFGWSPDRADSGALTLKLREAHFCRVRHCPICQWRRSLMWIARFLQVIPEVLAKYPKGRFIFLTLTQRNVPVSELRVTLRAMGKGWDRMRKRKEFAVVSGWLRTAEVTRGADGTAHPHYHALLLVPSDYFHASDKYVTQVGWTKLWRECLRLDYDPIVHVAAVKPKRGRPARGETLPALVNAAREAFKYAVKPSDMIADGGWLLELTRQLDKLRFIASGGVLKDILGERDKETNDDLLLHEGSEGEKGEAARLFFDWRRPIRRYKRQQEPRRGASVSQRHR